MFPAMYTQDAQQQALSFLIQQATHIEAEVNRIEYPDIQYPGLVPVDTSANEWAKSVTFFSMDRAGLADWFAGYSKDMPLADVSKEKFEHAIHMAGIGYRYTLEELGAAMLIPGTNLGAERADAARRAAEEFIDNVVINGDTSKGIEGLVNNSNVTILEAAPTGALNGNTVSPSWDDKTADQMILDVNNALTGVHVDSKTVEMADTVLLPVSELNRLATTARSSQSDITAFEWLMKYNVYTASTGRPLMIRALRGLETAGEGGVGRMIVYRRDPRVLKFHMPMPHRFLPVWQTGPMIFDVPGIFRIGGLEIRRPGAVRYVDNIKDPAYD